MKTLQLLRSLILLIFCSLASCSDDIGDGRVNNFHMQQFYEEIGSSNSDTIHTIVIAVKQQGRSELESRLREIYRPGSSKFRQYLSRSEVAAISNHAESLAIVSEYLTSHGFRIDSKTTYGEYITVSQSIGHISSIFAATFRRYGERNEIGVGRFVDTATTFTIPEEIRDHVETIFNLDQLPPPRAHRRRPSPAVRSASDSTVTPRASASSGDGYVDPPALLAGYGITNDQYYSQGSQCVYSSSNQNYSPTDLQEFQSEYNLPAASISVSFGGHNLSSVCTSNSDLCTEADLDVEYMLGLSPYVKSYYWYDNSTEYFVLDWIKSVASMTDPPLVISISYGILEAYVSRGYTHSFDTEAIKLALQGVSVFVAAGDDGVAGYLAREDAGYCGYYPEWPASSAYVTVVGGTMGLESGDDTEVTCSAASGGVITSGGGFSNLNSQPSYQTDAVNTYLNSFTKKTAPVQGSEDDGYYYGIYRVQGRAYPDLAVAAAKYRVYVGGSWQIISGTSAGTPVMAAIVAIINGMLLEKGLPSVGFMNYDIYANGSHFLWDIASGNNKCTAIGSSGDATCCDQGFYALRGWDPVTGMGYPDFQAMVSYFVYGNLTTLSSNAGTSFSTHYPGLFFSLLATGTVAALSLWIS